MHLSGANGTWQIFNLSTHFEPVRFKIQVHGKPGIKFFMNGECPVPEIRTKPWITHFVRVQDKWVPTGIGQTIENMYFVYVLLSKRDNRLYIGFTANVHRRLKDHNSGKVLSTQNRRPFKLLYYEAHLSKQDALRRERYFKTAKGKTTLKQLLRNSLQFIKNWFYTEKGNSKLLKAIAQQLRIIFNATL